MKVFLVEDDPIIIEGLGIALKQEGYEVEIASTVNDALKIVEQESDFAVCLLDLMLPDGDGYQILRAIRQKSQVPVIFLTACDDEIHTVLGFEQGCDDYIAKPFRIRELLVRMKAVIRRSNASASGIVVANGTITASNSADKVTDTSRSASSQSSSPVINDDIQVGQNHVNITTGKVYRGQEEIFLSAVEYRLLLVFIKNRGKDLSRQQILTDMWNASGEFVNDNTLTVYVKRLRNKLERQDNASVITTIRGIGYRMD